jgi:phospholipid-translocating ATPase
VDLFQEYEQDLGLRLRFEEAAANELQQGWNRGEKKSSLELNREAEIEDILSRPRIMEEGRSSATICRERRSFEQISTGEDVELKDASASAGDEERKSRPKSQIVPARFSERARPKQET